LTSFCQIRWFSKTHYVLLFRLNRSFSVMLVQQTQTFLCFHLLLESSNQITFCDLSKLDGVSNFKIIFENLACMQILWVNVNEQLQGIL